MVCCSHTSASHIARLSLSDSLSLCPLLHSSMNQSLIHCFSSSLRRVTTDGAACGAAGRGAACGAAGRGAASRGGTGADFPASIFCIIACCRILAASLLSITSCCHIDVTVNHRQVEHVPLSSWPPPRSSVAPAQLRVLCVCAAMPLASLPPKLHLVVTHQQLNCACRIECRGDVLETMQHWREGVLERQSTG